MNFTNFITESFDSQRDIEALADAIYKEAGRILSKNPTAFIIESKFVGLYLTVYMEDVNFKAKTKEVNEMLAQTHATSVDFKINDRNSKTTKGHYRTADFGSHKTHEIQILFNSQSYELHDLNEQYPEAKHDDSKLADLIEKTILIRYDTLVHELTHALDDFLSNGKAFANSYDAKDDPTHYLTSQHEINARFSQTITDKELKDEKLIASNPTKRSKDLGRGGFENYLFKFKQGFVGWDILTEKQQRQLTKRLYNEYMSLTRDEEQIILQRLLGSIAWNISFKERIDYRVPNKMEPRFKFNIKAELTKVIDGIIKGKISGRDLEKNYEGVYDVLVTNKDDNDALLNFLKELDLNTNLLPDFKIKVGRL
jgi:hypothetical protein